jgi:hypothetical protein
MAVGSHRDSLHGVRNNMGTTMTPSEVTALEPDEIRKLIDAAVGFIGSSKLRVLSRRFSGGEVLIACTVARVAEQTGRWFEPHACDRALFTEVMQARCSRLLKLQYKGGAM